MDEATGGSRPRRAPSANDRFKDRWKGRVAWSVVVAAILHASALGLWPTWERVRPTPDSDPIELVQVPLASLDDASPGRTGAPPTVRGVGEEPDSVPPDIRESSTSEEDEGDLADELRERLSARGGLVPTVTESSPEPGRDEPEPEILEEEETDDEEVASSGDGEDPDIEGRTATATERLTALDSGSLDLDRLSSIDPEMALVMPSNWVLIRNPGEVEDFIERRYRRGDLDRGASGRVSVALWIDERGSVEWAEISESSGRRDLDEVALALFSEVASFRAARVEGVPTSRSVIFSVSFPW